MEPILTFEVTNQHIKRTDAFRVAAGSRNYLRARFSFLTREWSGAGKTAVFGTYPVILEEDTCLVPWEVLGNPGSFAVSVFAGDLITADKAEIRVFESGYREDMSEGCKPTPDFLAQLMTLLQSKADGLSYEDSILSLLSGETVLGTVKIKGGGYERKVKTEMDETAEANVLYCLGIRESLTINLPDTAQAGDEIGIIWYNEVTSCAFTVSGNVIPFDYTPMPNTRSELSALYDGTRWSVLWNETEVVL